MTEIERFNQHCGRGIDDPEQTLALWAPQEAKRSAEREAERMERAKLIEALSLVAGARESEKAEWKVTADKLNSEVAETRNALAVAQRAANEATAEAARAREAWENDRVLYQTDRTSWAHERRQLEIKVQALKKEAARGWLSRLVRGVGAL
jgi:hypothetical protein